MPGTKLVNDCNYLVVRLEHSDELIFINLFPKLVDAGRQAKVDIYDDSEQTVSVYADGWHYRLTTLRKAVGGS